MSSLTHTNIHTHTNTHTHTQNVPSRGERKAPDYDVVVCGDGLFALAVAGLLRDRGVRVLRLHLAPSGLSPLFPGLGVLWPTLTDPPTRLIAAHGQRVAESVVDFVRGASAATASWLSSASAKSNKKMPTARSLRLGLAAHERAELSAAARAFSGIHVIEGTQGGLLDEGVATFFGDHAANMAAQLLESEPPEARRCTVVTSVDEKSSCVKVTCEGGEVIVCEMAVLGLGAATGRVLPRMGTICVPASDVLLRFSLSDADVRHDVPSFEGAGLDTLLCFRASSGHIAGVLSRNGGARGSLEVAFSGPRFALHHAGMGWDAADVQRHPEWIRDGSLREGLLVALRGLGEVLPGWSADVDRVSKALGAAPNPGPVVATECWPCDELPLLGDMGLHGRILGSAGWLGCGHAVALWCAQALCDMALLGRIESVPTIPLLSPRRFMPS